MTGTTHYLGGVLAGVTLVACSTPDLTTAGGVGLAISAIATASIGGILPDIDHHNSTASKKFKILSMIYKLISKLGKFFKADVFEHRGVMHTLLIPIILLVIQLIVQNPIADYLLSAGMVGYLSHITLDALNPMGVPILSPFYNEKVRFLPKKICIKTSSGPEFLVKLLLAVGIVFNAKPVASMLLTGLTGNLASIAGKFSFFS